MPTTYLRILWVSTILITKFTRYYQYFFATDALTPCRCGHINAYKLVIIWTKLIPPTPDGLQFERENYVNLVDWTGGIMRSDKRGEIDTNLPSIHQ
jgi:hypothetical protein